RSPADGPGPCRGTEHREDLRDRHPHAYFTNRSRAGRAFAQGACGRGALRSLQPRALRDGCVPLPDRACRRGDTEDAGRCRCEEGVPVLPRGGGTSQSGQTVGRALVLDFSKYLNRLVAVDQAAASCVVEPGIVLDELNRQLKSTGLWFPVDVSTASRATIGGM